MSAYSTDSMNIEGKKQKCFYIYMHFGLHLGGWILSTPYWCKFGLECFGLYQDGFSLTWNSASVRLGRDLRGVVLAVVG